MYRVERNPEHDASQPDGKELKRNLSAPKGRGVAPASSDDVEIASSVEADVNAMIRSGFVRKVYSILSVQLAVTFGLILAFTYMESIHTAIVAPASCPVLIPPSCYNASVSQEMCTQMHTDAKETYLADNPKCPKFAASYTCHAIRDSWSCGMTIYWLAYLVSLVAFIQIACCGDNARIYPKNYILLGIFTVAESFFVGVFAAYMDAHDVITAMGITIGITAGLTLYACNTKTDFTSHQTYIFAAGWAFMLFGFVFMFGGFANKTLYIFYCLVGVLLFSLYLVYDTQLIVGGKHAKFTFSVDDYVFAALMLYVDIINLFIYLLALMSSSD